MKAPREEENKEIKRGEWLSGREANTESQETWRRYLKISQKKQKHTEGRPELTAARFSLGFRPPR